MPVRLLLVFLESLYVINSGLYTLHACCYEYRNVQNLQGAKERPLGLHYETL